MLKKAIELFQKFVATLAGLLTLIVGFTFSFSLVIFTSKASMKEVIFSSMLSFLRLFPESYLKSTLKPTINFCYSIYSFINQTKLQGISKSFVGIIAFKTNGTIENQAIPNLEAETESLLNKVLDCLVRFIKDKTLRRAVESIMVNKDYSSMTDKFVCKLSDDEDNDVKEVFTQITEAVISVKKEEISSILSSVSKYFVDLIDINTARTIEQSVKIKVELQLEGLIYKVINEAIIPSVRDKTLHRAIGSMMLNNDRSSCPEHFICKLSDDSCEDIKVLCSRVTGAVISAESNEIFSIFVHIGEVLKFYNTDKRLYQFKAFLDKSKEALRHEENIDKLLSSFVAFPDITDLDIEAQNTISKIIFDKIEIHNSIDDKSSKILIASPQGELTLKKDSEGAVNLFEAKFFDIVFNKNWNTAFDLISNQIVQDLWKSYGLVLSNITDSSHFSLQNISNNSYFISGQNEVCIKPSQTVSIYLKQRWRCSDLLVRDKSYALALDGLLTDLGSKADLLDKFLEIRLEGGLGRLIYLIAYQVFQGSELLGSLVGADKSEARDNFDKALELILNSGIMQSYLIELIKKLEYSRLTFLNCSKSLLLNYDDSIEIDYQYTSSSSASMFFDLISQDTLERFKRSLEISASASDSCYSDLKEFILLMFNAHEAHNIVEEITQIIDVIATVENMPRVVQLLGMLIKKNEGEPSLFILMKNYILESDLDNKKSILNKVMRTRSLEIQSSIKTLKLLLPSIKAQTQSFTHLFRSLIPYLDSELIAILSKLEPFYEQIVILLKSDEVIDLTGGVVNNLMNHGDGENVGSLLNFRSLDSYKQQQACSLLISQFKVVFNASDNKYDFTAAMKESVGSMLDTVDTSSSYSVYIGVKVCSWYHTYSPECVNVNAVRLMMSLFEAWQDSGNGGAWNLINPIFYGRFGVYAVSDVMAPLISESFGLLFSKAEEITSPAYEGLSFCYSQVTGFGSKLLGAADERGANKSRASP